MNFQGLYLMVPFGSAECHERLYGESLYISLQKLCLPLVMEIASLVYLPASDSYRLPVH